MVHVYSVRTVHPQARTWMTFTTMTRTWWVAAWVSVLLAACADKVPTKDAGTRYDASQEADTGLGDDSGIVDASPDDAGVRDADIDAGHEDASESTALLRRANLYPAAERAESPRHRLQGHMASGVEEASNGRHQLRGGFAPLGH